MNRITLGLATILTLAFTQVTAQDLNKGLEAYDAGDYATALQELEPLAKQGNAIAQRKLGNMYKYGDGVLKDATEAVKWYRLSAEQGNVLAQYFLGFMYDTGKGILQDDAEAVKGYQLSAEQGYAHAPLS